MKSVFTVTSDELDKEDLRALLQTVRDCEMANFPEKIIYVTMYVPELSVDETTDILNSIKPPYGLGAMVFGFKRREE